MEPAEDRDRDAGADEGTGAEPALFDVPARVAALREQVRGAQAEARPGRERAAGLPYARLALDVDLSHLDRPFDYLVPADLDEQARPGARIRARFAGQVVDGFVLERLAESDFDGRFEWVQRVVSPEPVLTPEVAELARTVADRYAGTMADVLRLAVPPRHANAEKKPRPEPVAESALVLDPGPWDPYQGGHAFIEALAGGEQNPRAVWQCLPGHDWAEALAAAIVATAAGGRGALAVVPDRRDLDRLDRALTAAFQAAAALGGGAGGGAPGADDADSAASAGGADGADSGPAAPDAAAAPRHVVLAEDLGPAKRYGNWLAVLRGDVKVAVGTRSAAFAPVADLGLVAIWDDGDDLHAEPRAPYPHVREVLTLRAHRQKTAALIGGYACTAEAAQLVESGWALPLRADRATADRAAPLIRSSGEEFEKQRDAAAAAARLPSLAWRTAREALNHGPVLVQVPRGGYASALACVRCRKHARCVHCHGPLALTSGHAMAHCAWCGRPAGGWRCDGTVDDRPCAADRFRLTVVGVARTAEELGRAFPQVRIIRSAQDSVVARVGPEPALVIATPGAEPVAEGGYQAALLLDGWILLGRRDLRAGEETLRRWMNAAALVKPRSAPRPRPDRRSDRQPDQRLDPQPGQQSSDRPSDQRPGGQPDQRLDWHLDGQLDRGSTEAGPDPEVAATASASTAADSADSALSAPVVAAQGEWPGVAGSSPAAVQGGRSGAAGSSVVAAQGGRSGATGFPVVSARAGRLGAAGVPAAAAQAESPGAAGSSAAAAQGGWPAAADSSAAAAQAEPSGAADSPADRRRLAEAAPGGTVIVMAEPALAPTQALIRWDPVWHARRELEDRGALHYPPAARVAELTGTPQAVAEELRLLDLPPEAEILGPVAVETRPDRADRAERGERAGGVGAAEGAERAGEAERGGKPARSGRGSARRAAAIDQARRIAALSIPDTRGTPSTPGPTASRAAAPPPRTPSPPPGPETHRVLVRVPRSLGADLAARVREAQGVRSARKAEDWVRVRIDPMQIG